MQAGGAPLPPPAATTLEADEEHYARHASQTCDRCQRIYRDMEARRHNAAAPVDAPAARPIVQAAALFARAPPAHQPPPSQAPEATAPQADAKYHDQLIAALHFLQSAIGTVVRMDELLLLPGSGPLQDLLQGPRAAQLADMATGQECIAVVTRMCLEAWAQAAEARSQAAETACEQVNGLAE